MREWVREDMQSDSHEGLCTKNPDALPSYTSVDSQLEKNK